MKTLREACCLGTVTISLSLGAVAAVMAESGNAQDVAHEAHAHTPEQSHEAANLQSVDKILAAIHTKQAELTTAISEKRLNDVHHFAFAIRDLALPLARKVAPENQERVQGSLNNISKLAEQLDSTGDAGDQAGTEANLKKLNGVLKVLESQVQAK